MSAALGVPVTAAIDGRSRTVYLAVWGPQSTGAAARSPLRLRRVLCDTLAEAQAVAVAGCAWLYEPAAVPFAKVSKIVVRIGGSEDRAQMETARWLLRDRWSWEEV